MLKVVIADDEARILSLIRLLPDWDALGIEVVGTAGNGLEALALIERERPDILITDIRMPGCQGLELIERARRTVPDIEIIIISGYAHFEYAQTAIKLGVGDYLLKPIKKDELTATLSKLAQRCYAKHPSDPGTAHDGEGRARAALREKLVREAVSGRAFPKRRTIWHGPMDSVCRAVRTGPLCSSWIIVGWAARRWRLFMARRAS